MPLLEWQSRCQQTLIRKRLLFSNLQGNRWQRSDCYCKALQHRRWLTAPRTVRQMRC